MVRTRALLAVVALTLTVAGCGASQQDTPTASSLPSASDSSTAAAPSTSASQSPTPRPSHRASHRPSQRPSQQPSHRPSARPSASPSPSPARPRVTKLMVVPVENHTYAQMRDQMPWTFSLAQQYGYATHFRAITHPSLPNYLAIAGGSTFGVTDDADPAVHPLPGSSVFGLALAHGGTAATYVEGMAQPCQQTAQGSAYYPKHNPWTYFADERAACQAHDVPIAALAGDVSAGRLPDAGMVVPDMCNIGHDCPLSTTDAWLHNELSLLMSGPDWRSGHLAIVVTADEDDRSGDNTVLTVVLHPSLHGVVVDTPLTHYSLSRLYAEVLGAAPLREAATAPSMATAFGLPVGPG